MEMNVNDSRNDEAPPSELLSEFEELLRTVAEEVGKSAVVPAVVEAQAHWETLLERQVTLIETGQHRAQQQLETLLERQVTLIETVHHRAQQQLETLLRSQVTLIETEQQRAQQQWETLLQRQITLIEALQQQAEEDSRRASEMQARLERLARLAVGFSATSLLVAVVLVVAVLLGS